MADRHAVPIDGGVTVQVRFTDADDGDFRVSEPNPGVEDRRAALIDRPWSWVRQVHEATVLEVGEPGDHAGETADGLWTTTEGCPIAVTTADCAPVVLVSSGGVAVVHAGWRGIVAGIIGVAARSLGAVGGTPVATLLGPCIGPAGYRFGREDLDRIVEQYGPEVESVTADGDSALDVPTAVGVAVAEAGWPRPDRPACTSGTKYFSHRTRADTGRQTAVAWLESSDRGGR